ncbi:LysM domain-containing protein [Brevibacterium sanguinis]|uniref:LysM domain-containing protein n=2 Tax=Brevibacterium TaxID=1696 RepID=A0A366IK63_9MICO|nr:MULTISPECIES: LysM domain-containing protein [Brevibacterium]RBP66151.1 LysM domain-containing protein [Brevibacterium sanguinis]RBP72802.1 LysM domain-containing protein [Brevibacterium celere]
MYLLIVCAASWLALLGAFSAAWVHAAQPWSTAELLVLGVVGTAVLAFGRIGVTALIALALGLLPHGALRRRMARTLLRCGPVLLRSSVLAVVSASLIAQTAQATTPVETPAAAAGAVAGASVPPDPGWPTSDESPPVRPDPGWPTTPPAEDERGPGDSEDRPEEPGARPAPDGPRDDDDSRDDAPRGHPDEDHPSEGTGASDDPAASADPVVHVVVPGDCLWSIAAAYSEGSTARAAREIHEANRAVIGPDPNLIMPGQRLEIDS